MAAATNPIEGDLHRMWELTGLRRHAQALALSARFPEQRDALYLQALNLRLLGRVCESLAALNRLEQRHSRCGHLYQERGHCYIALRDLPRAAAAFLQAIQLNPALPASWQMLQRLHPDGATTATQQLAALSKLPAEIVEASSLFADSFLLPADTITRAYLRKDTGNVGAMRLLARIGMERNVLAEAESLLESVLELAPDFHAARLDLAMVLLRRQRYAGSRQQAQLLLKADPHNREFLKLYGAACIGLGDHEPVISLYERLLAGGPQSGPEVADLRLWRANALKSTGRPREAVADYRAALVAKPDFAVAWFSLANLKTHRFDTEEVVAMRALESKPGTLARDRCYLCFALGKALEDRGDYATSWHYYARGNELMRVESRYRPDRVEINTRLLQKQLTAEFFAARAGWGDPGPAPIFILGLPRSGSTLLEQILASHSRVEGTEELTEVERYSSELSGRGPEALSDLTAAEARRLGERYLSETRAYRRLGRANFIDKMPNNFWHIGLIQLMLPNARIIDARREPMACCFGNLKQLFSHSRQDFSYGVEDIARYYRTYLDLMRHWKEVLPGRVLTIHHEDVVEDLELSVRRILDYCGLDFEPACLEFHQTRRSVHSASSEQVRQPISREGLHQWRNYEPWLGPLRAALGDALLNYRD